MSSSNSSDGSFDMITPAEPNDGLQYVAGGSRKKKDRKERRKSSRRSSSRRSMGDSSSKLSRGSISNNNNSEMAPFQQKSESADAFDFGSAYVRSKNEEHISLVPSDNSDPNDPLAANGPVEKFHDEEDDLDEVEMREEKLRNFDAFGDTQKKESALAKLARFLKLYCVPLLICLLFVLGLVAVILYLAGVGKSTTTKEQALQAVPPAPESLSLMCDVSEQGGITPEMEIPELCKDSCNKAECCWNPNGIFVCSDDTKKQCPSYQTECTPWKEQLAEDTDGLPEMDVPPVPAGLQTSCARTFFEVTADCKTGCATANCCWNEKANAVCTPDTVHNCPNYREICSFLNDELGPDGNHPDTVSGSGTSNDSNSINTENAPFPKAPDGLSVYCDPAEMEEISLHICQDKCAAAECCWKTGVGVQSCLYKHPAACHDYTRACSILNELKTAPDNSHDITSETPPPATAQSNANTLSAAPDGLADLCSKDRIDDPDTGGEALIQCEQQCLKASCCWQPNAASPCTGNELCAAYAQPCSLFTSLFDKPQDYNPNSETLPPMTISNVPRAPDTINDNCSPAVLKTSVEGGKFIVECEKQCLMGACCWKENHPTHCPDATECSAYQRPCGTNLVNALVALESGLSPSSSSGTAPAPAPAPTSPAVVENNVPEAPDNIGMICSPDVLKLSVSDGDFIIQCEKECLEAACCWKEKHATVCPNAPQCDEYLVPCGEHLAPVLAQIELDENDEDDNFLDDDVDDDDVDDDDDDIVDDDGNSANAPPVIPNAPDDMELRCSLANLNSNPQGRGFCEESCSEAECCWTNGGAAQPECTGNPLCIDYQLCANLLSTSPIGGTNSGNTPPSPPDNLKDICAAGSILDLTGLEICKEACEAAACCWMDDSNSQTCKTAVECRTYETECALMRTMVEESLGNAGGSGGGSGSTADIASVCDTSTQFYLRSRCEEACRPGDCCRDGTACLSSIDCNVYEPCLVLEGSFRRLLRHR